MAIFQFAMFVYQRVLWINLEPRKYADVIVPFPIASLCGLRALQHLAADGRTPLVVPKRQSPFVAMWGQNGDLGSSLFTR